MKRTVQVKKKFLKQMSDPNDSLKKEVENIKSLLSNLYVPKHFDSLMKKIGNIERNVYRAHESMNTCYYVTFFIVLLFAVLVFACIYIIWRMNYFKFLLRHNKFARFTRPSSCYTCYRPWRKHQTHSSTLKNSFSSPELVVDYKSPMPLIMQENSENSRMDSALSSDSED